MKIVRIKKNEADDWLLNKHYLKRIPTFVYGYGLVIGDNVEGISVFSSPVGKFNFSVEVLELSRLIINEGLEENALSQFLSQSIKELPVSTIIVSYADENWGHHGYIYQATNWLYTGISTNEKKYFLNGEEVHRRTLYDLYGTSSIPTLKEMGHHIEYEEQKGKHRYFQVSGTKNERRKLKTQIKNKYEIYPYPKGKNKRYDASYIPEHKSWIGKFF